MLFKECDSGHATTEGAPRIIIVADGVSEAVPKKSNTAIWDGLQGKMQIGDISEVLGESITYENCLSGKHRGKMEECKSGVTRIGSWCRRH